MINNLELIKPLLTFENKDDFYMLYILKRKKDQPEGEKENSQSVRMIKYYLVSSVEYIEKRWDEITHLCEYFKARAYIHVQGQNHKDVSLEMNVQLARRMQSGAINQSNLFETVVGQIPVKEKRWIVDIDTKDITTVNRINNLIRSIAPEGDKLIAMIPTKNGYHLITKPFNVQEFNKYMSLQGEVPDIQKKNPTLLYLPNSLHNGS